MSTPLPVIPSVFRVAFNWVETASGQTAVNVMHFKSASPLSVAADCATVIESSWTNLQLEAMTGTASITSYSITPLDGISPTLTHTPAGAIKWQGGSSGDWSPQVAVIAKFQTLARGRQNRGHVYLPFVADITTTAGHLSASMAAEMSTAWQTFQTHLKANTPIEWSLHVASYARPPSSGTPHSTEVTAITIESPLGTQRRRMTRVRP